MVSYASFATRRQVVGGGFYDYTARYGGVRDEDRKTLRESLEEESSTSPEYIEDLTRRLQIHHLLDLPLVALSNGQTRRAHIVKELLHNPQLLLLDEPLSESIDNYSHRKMLTPEPAGLDVENRPRLLGILRELHQSHKPRIILGLRKHDSIPEWIKNVVHVAKDHVEIGSKAEMQARFGADRLYVRASLDSAIPDPDPKSKTGKVLLEMKGLSVAYQDRRVKPYRQTIVSI